MGRLRPAAAHGTIEQVDDRHAAARAREHDGVLSFKWRASSEARRHHSVGEHDLPLAERNPFYSRALVQPVRISQIIDTLPFSGRSPSRSCRLLPPLGGASSVLLARRIDDRHDLRVVDLPNLEHVPGGDWTTVALPCRLSNAGSWAFLWKFGAAPSRNEGRAGTEAAIQLDLMSLRVLFGFRGLRTTKMTPDFMVGPRSCWLDVVGREGPERAVAFSRGSSPSWSPHLRLLLALDGQGAVRQRDFDVRSSAQEMTVTRHALSSSVTSS
jgi:hypothetical protein